MLAGCAAVDRDQRIDAPVWKAEPSHPPVDAVLVELSPGGVSVERGDNVPSVELAKQLEGAWTQAGTWALAIAGDVPRADVSTVLQSIKHSSVLASFASSHSSTPFWTKPSPQVATIQVDKHSSVSSSFASSHSSSPSTTPSPHSGIEPVSVADALSSVVASESVSVCVGPSVVTSESDPEPSVSVIDVSVSVSTSVVGEVVVAVVVVVVSLSRVVDSSPEQAARAQPKTTAGSHVSTGWPRKLVNILNVSEWPC